MNKAGAGYEQSPYAKRPWLKQYDYLVRPQINYPRRSLYEIPRRTALEIPDETALAIYKVPLILKLMFTENAGRENPVWGVAIATAIVT